MDLSSHVGMGEIEVCAQWRSGSRQILRCQNCLEQMKGGCLKREEYRKCRDGWAHTDNSSFVEDQQLATKDK